MGKRLYYNPIEYPEKMRFISKERGIDFECEPWTVPDESCPYGFEEAFKAIKRKEFDEIIVTVTSHCEVYYAEKSDNGFYKRVFCTGNLPLSNFSNGGGYLKDAHIYHEDEVKSF